MEWIFSLDNINNVAKEFLKAIDDKKVIVFHGPMGSGKTTFIHALCDVMCVKDVVGSPTFSIINEYAYVPIDIGSEVKKNVLFHIDLYRLKDEEEAIKAGVEDVIYSGNICLVEWPEKAPAIFPENTLHVFIELLDTERRRLNIKKF